MGHVTTQMRYAIKPPKTRFKTNLAEVVFTLVFVALLIGSVLVGRDILASSRLLAQVSQIGKFDSAVSEFYDKYEGLPGDLLALKASRSGLPYGDGTPAHGDGDGKISPCNPGWQWNFGCETALFWGQLAAAKLLPEDFSPDVRYGNDMLHNTLSMDIYLPASPLPGDLYIAIWSTDPILPSPGRQLPYGNYYEISRITGAEHGKLEDDNHAMTPLQARSLDEKIDDGSPFTGRVMVNGVADWPRDAWGSFARRGKDSCVSPEDIYNVYDRSDAHRLLCHVAIALNCCGTGEYP